ncbi:MAG: DUF5312 family protein [Alkalispirochaeta sp.]
MARTDTFETLTRSLSTQERQQMLASIRKSMETQAAPIAPAPEEDPPPIETHLKTLGFFDRIRLFFARLFTGRTKEEIIQGWIMRALQDRLSKMRVEGIDAKTGQFREAFAADIERLQHEAVRLAEFADAAAGKRGELVLALAIHFFPGIHRELFRKTGTEYVRTISEESERFLRRQLTSAFEEMINDIPTSGRNGMRNALDQADTLYRLGAFSFAGILRSFEGAGMETGRHCAFDYVIRNIESLQGILASLSGPVDLPLLETLVMIAKEPIDGEEDQEVFQELLESGMKKITDSLSVFRTFSATYPLTLITRIVKEDPWWHPREDHGGEDWISIYRNFFLERIQQSILTVTMASQVRKQLETLKELSSEGLEPITGLPADDDGSVSDLYCQGIAVKALAGGVWNRVRSNLKIVLTSGEFYKSSNRAQFNDAYNELEKIPLKVDDLESRLAPGGPWADMIAAANNPGQIRKVGTRIDEDIRLLVTDAQTTVEMMVNLLGGILYARPGSSFDTLANYGQIGGRRNAELIDELKETHGILQSFMTTMGELGAIEKRAAENGIRLQGIPGVRGGSDGGNGGSPG